MQQNQVRILIVAILILMVGSLLYYFQKNIMGLFSRKDIPVTKPKDENAKERIIRDRSGKRIEVFVKGKSQIEGHSVVVENELKLINDLIDWNVFGKTYGNTKEEVKKENLLELITVILTDKPQPYFLEGSVDKKLVSSAGFELKGKEMNILVYIAPEFLDESDKYFEKEALRMLYGIAYPPVKGKEQSLTDAFKAYIQNKTSNNITYFRVVKK